MRDDREPALREELRQMITGVQAGTYQPGSFDDKITLSYRIHRTSHRHADGLGGYEVHTEVDGDTRAEMLYAVYQAMSSGGLPAELTKTDTGRTIIISARLRPVLDMVRKDPATDQDHKPQAYVFGNALGHHVSSPKKAWEVTVLKAQGITPEWTKGIKKLTPAMREHLRAIDLHFHDLRHEAGSRFIGGVANSSCPADAGPCRPQTDQHISQRDGAGLGRLDAANGRCARASVYTALQAVRRSG